MTARRSARLLRGVASLAATLALLIGVPILLATLVGWPLPTSLPSVDSLENAARTGISDQVVVNALAVIAWLAWAQLTLALVVAILAPAGEMRTRYLICFILVWVVVGNVVAGLFMSAGPAFYGFVTGDTARYAEQLAWLGEFGGGSAYYQAYLWDLQEAGVTGFGSGISAFPSVHVALAALNAMFAWSLDRRLGLAAWGYAAFVQFSSVYLAWHYAIDGYAGIVLAALIYVGLSKFMQARASEQTT